MRKEYLLYGRGIRIMSSEHFQLGGSTAGNSQAFYTPANYTGCLENYSGIY